MSDERDDRENGQDEPRDRAEEAPGAKPPATVLGAILSSAMERLQTTLQPGEGNAQSTQNVQLWLSRVLESMSESRKRREAEKALPTTEAEALTGAADDEAKSNVIDLAQVRDARRGAGPSVDVKAVVEHAVSGFVRERLAQEQGAEAVPDEVTIDGEFVARHGADLLRVVMSSVGQAWLGALTGALPESVAEAVKDRDAAPPAQESKAEEDAPSRPAVHYDVLNIVAGLLRPPPPPPPPTSDEDDGDDAH